VRVAPPERPFPGGVAGLMLKPRRSERGPGGCNMPPVMTESLAEEYAAKFPRSRALSERARGVFRAGVSHDLRALEPFPVDVDRAEGARKWTAEGVELVDYWAGHGALLLGHSHPAVVEAVRRQAAL